MPEEPRIITISHVDKQVSSQYRIQNNIVLDICTALAKHLEFPPSELSLSFINDDEMQRVNSQYRHLEKTTDVLSFPQIPWHSPWKTGDEIPREDQFSFPEQDPTNSQGRVLLGDILISPCKAELNAADIGHDLDREICFLIIHGFLHLLGYDHIEAEDEKLMLAEQNRLLGILSHSPKPLWHACVGKI